MSAILRNLFAAALLLAGAMQQASADIVTVTGDTSGLPTFLRPGDYGGPTPPWITGVSYQAFNVSATVSDWQYTFMANCEYSCVSFFYENAFDPADPLKNLMATSADAYGFTALMANIEPGQRYVYVVSGYNDWDAGQFSLTVGGKGDISISAVPEPSSGLMLLGGLAGIAALARRARRNG